MTAHSRLEKLEAKLKPEAKKIYWIMWQNCEWKECEGIYRNKSETIEDFKNRVIKSIDKKYLWVK
jgi:hypothetical protein